jgi:hypothetical protein
LVTQRRFEGQTLATVLAKVQKEIGTEAKIVSAQRARTGGLLGFFQKEKFEVIVEVPEPGTVTATASSDEAATSAEPVSAGAMSIMDLVERANAEEAAPSAAAAPPRSTRPAAPTTPRTGNGDASSHIPLPPPAPSTWVEAEEEPAEEWVDESELPEDEPETVLPRSTVIKGDHASRETPPRVSTESKNFAEVLSRVAYQADMTSDSQVKEGAPVIDLDPQTSEKAMIDGRPAYLDVRPTGVTPQQQSVVPPFRTRISDHPLSTLGLPAPYIPKDLDPQTMQDALTAMLERLPQPPAIRPGKGSIIAVVGEIVEALELAEDLADRWKRPAEEIVLASQQYRGRGSNTVLRNVRNAEDARRSWSRRPRPTIVAIDAFPGSKDTGWAEHMLTALEPIATYGVADATRKAEDVAVWASQLGGIDCLAVNHMEETVSPASILATGIPVERIEGRPATAQYWSILLTERLNAI